MALSANERALCLFHTALGWLAGGGSVLRADVQISVQWADTSTSQGESDSFSFANKTLGFLPVLVLAFLFFSH